MPTDLEIELEGQIKRLVDELGKRTTRHLRVEPYVERDMDNLSLISMPTAVVEAKVTKAYQALMGMAGSPWGKPIVGAKLDRLEVTGVQSPDKRTNDVVMGHWQDNAMDLESKLGHHASLLDGRCHALVWPETPGKPEISIDDVTQMIVEYEEGSRRRRRGALRLWRDDDGREHVTLYRPEGIYKFSKKKATDTGPGDWRRREVKGENWPVPNPWNVVPVVEIAVNRRIKAGRFAHARGEFEDLTGLIDRIDLLTFLGLIVAIWMGFPLRGIIGDKIIRDDDGKPISPFDVKPDQVVQLENPNAKPFHWDAADRGNLSIYSELNELCALTSTPRHYMPMEGGISNVGEPTVRAFEGSLHAVINGSHKPTLGEGWEEVLRLCGLMGDEKVELSPRAALTWADHESRSLAERADAASKLKDVIPWQAVAQKALDATTDEISQWETWRSGDAFTQLVTAASSTSTSTAPAAAATAPDGAGEPAAA